MTRRKGSVVVHVRGSVRSADVDLNALLGSAAAADPGLRELVIRFDREGRAVDKPTLTPREAEILAYVAQGFTNEQIATCLWLTPATVKFHLRNAFRRLGVHGRGEAARLAWERRLLPTDQVSDGSGRTSA